MGSNFNFIHTEMKQIIVSLSSLFNGLFKVCLRVTLFYSLSIITTIVIRIMDKFGPLPILSIIGTVTIGTMPKD